MTDDRGKLATYVARNDGIERALCAVMMHAPKAREAIVRAAPNAVEAFCDEDLARLSRLALEARGPLAPEVADAAGGGFPPGFCQDTFDAFDPGIVEQLPVLVRRLVGLWHQRLASDALGEAQDALASGERVDVDAVLARHAEEVEGIIRSSAQAVDPSAGARLEDMRKRADDGKVVIPTPVGMGWLGDQLGGIRVGGADSMVVMGAPKTGKTRFVMNLVMNLFARSPGLRVSWISSESGVVPDDIVAGFVCMLAVRLMVDDGITGVGLSAEDYAARRFGTGEAGDMIRSYVDSAEEQVALWKLRVHGPAVQDGDARRLSSALELARLGIDLHGTNLVVVDNYQAMYDERASRSDSPDYIAMSRVVTEFGALVSSRKVALVGISQLSSSDEAMGGKKLSYEAASVLFLTRDDTTAKDEVRVASKYMRRRAPFAALCRWEPRSGLILHTEEAPQDERGGKKKWR